MFYIELQKWLFGRWGDLGAPELVRQAQLLLLAGARTPSFPAPFCFGSWLGGFGSDRQEDMKEQIRI